jgi:hypothetical protein
MNKFAAMLVVPLFTVSAFGDTPATPGAPPVTTGAPSVTPGAPNAIEGQPAMYFGVKSCGKTVMWVLLTNGHFFRVDEEHSPPDMNAFMKQLSSVKGDIVEIPCGSAI